MDMFKNVIIQILRVLKGIGMFPTQEPMEQNTHIYANKMRSCKHTHAKVPMRSIHMNYMDRIIFHMCDIFKPVYDQRTLWAGSLSFLQNKTLSSP